ncbi:hypothetical protein LSAT2_014106 [Lamellibrachia satsuma]|nr:hypothetical protein LSAT2_014106 [Lamellibrachia satsuma]
MDALFIKTLNNDFVFWKYWTSKNHLKKCTDLYINIDVNECASFPCLNGGTCVDRVGGFTCQCKSGRKGFICQADIIECNSNPCTNGGMCVQGVHSYSCNCEPRYYGFNCETVIPPSAVKRVNIQLSLQGETFAKTLEDKSSEAHKTLKKTVTVALETILNEKLGHGEYNIVDVTFSAGSIVVNYVLEMMKDNHVAVESIVRDTILDNNGRFAGFHVDAHSVKASEKTTTIYCAQFRVPDLEFKKVWGDNTSSDYATLAREVEKKLQKVYHDEIGPQLADVADITFREGSVIVEFSLWVVHTVNQERLSAIFTSQRRLTIAGKDVDLDSFRLSCNKLEDAGFPWLLVLIGSIIGTALLILVVFVVRSVVRKRNLPTESGTTVNYRYRVNTFTFRVIVRHYLDEKYSGEGVLKRTQQSQNHAPTIVRIS